jgi:hypothetical protein
MGGVFMRSNSAVYLVLAIVCLTATSAAVADDWYPRVKTYELDVQFFPDEARMEGRAVVGFETASNPDPKTTFYLHGELSVDSLKIEGTSIEYKSDQEFYNYEYSLIATACEFALSEADIKRSLTVFYSGHLNPSVAGSPSNYMRIDRDGVFLRAYGYSMWFPTFLPARANVYSVDFPKVTIRTPAEFRSVFVGTKIAEYEDSGWRVSEWTADDVSLFYAQCTAQRYVVTAEGDYFLYHYNDSLSTVVADQILAFADRTNSLFDQYYRRGSEGGQFYIIEMPKYGDISSGNVTGLTSTSWQSFMEEKYRQRHLAHELVHPFVWVPVDRSDPLWSMAIEGFPSYFHLPVLAESLGDDWYADYLSRVEKRYLEQRKTGLNWRDNPLPPEKPIIEISANEMSTYKDEFVLSDRALLFLNYLYSRMGKHKFFAFTTDMFNRDHLTTESFRNLIEQHLPGSSDDVNLWLSTTDYPERLHFGQYAGSEQ